MGKESGSKTGYDKNPRGKKKAKKKSLQQLTMTFRPIKNEMAKEVCILDSEEYSPIHYLTVESALLHALG